MKKLLLKLFLCLLVPSAFGQNVKPALDYLDVFQLEYASDPMISPDGKMVLYRRMGFDIMEDKSYGNLWIISSDGSMHYKLTSSDKSESQGVWSPSGDRIAFSSSSENGAEIYIHWITSGQVARITQLEKSPSGIKWSPDGKHLAFRMKVDSKPPVIASMPSKPKGAKWADTPRITDRLKHESDGSGYIDPGFAHIFVVPSEGGYARQVSSGDFNHTGNLSWARDGKYLLCSGNRSEDWEYDYNNSEIYRIDLHTGETVALTDRIGEDFAPEVSPNGQLVAYISAPDVIQPFTTYRLHVMDIDGKNKRVLTKDLDSSVSNISWSNDGQRIYFMYDYHGNTKISFVDLKGKQGGVVNDIGGTSIGRPYGSGSFSLSRDQTLAYTKTRPEYPAEVVIGKAGSGSHTQLTHLNEDLLDYRTLGKVEEVWYKSTFDNRDVQGWIVYPPDFDKTKYYPLLVENHGGPILNYGDRFSVEMQLYAAKGYIVFYPNPRGSTSYGEEFANLLYNNYPGQDYNDVMDGVDHLISKGIAHEDQLYVTGGSAGGIMTAWMIGKNNRFEAAVVAKPVMNWISKTLVADNYYGYAEYRYPGQPWENFENYWKFSPLSLVGNIQTPTMVMVGMNDLRTPPSEAKQLYHALKLRKVETILVEIPGAYHNIAGRPSQLITKVAHTLAWFDKYGKEKNKR